MEVTPRLRWPSWRWMTLSGTPSRASSIACACRNWCGAKRRRTPARDARRRNVDSQPGLPEHDDQPARAGTVDAIAAAAHDRDDLLGSRWVRRVAAALVS